MNELRTSDTMYTNGGHGHVFPRPDGVKARCGGPALCSECARDLARKESAQGSSNEKVATPGATFSGEDSVSHSAESSRPRELLTAIAIDRNGYRHDWAERCSTENTGCERYYRADEVDKELQRLRGSDETCEQRQYPANCTYPKCPCPAWDTCENIPKDKDFSFQLGELLAVIHRDGGQYQEKHGIAVATADAIKTIHVLRGDCNCKVCDGLGYSVGVSKRIPCKDCLGTGLAKPNELKANEGQS